MRGIYEGNFMKIYIYLINSGNNFQRGKAKIHLKTNDNND